MSQLVGGFIWFSSVAQHEARVIEGIARASSLTVWPHELSRRRLPDTFASG